MEVASASPVSPNADLVGVQLVPEVSKLLNEAEVKAEAGRAMEHRKLIDAAVKEIKLELDRGGDVRRLEKAIIGVDMARGYACLPGVVGAHACWASSSSSSAPSSASWPWWWPRPCSSL